MTRILYVEDNDENVYMLKMRFELLDGFEVMTAKTAGKQRAGLSMRRQRETSRSLPLPHMQCRARASRRLQPVATSSTQSQSISIGSCKRSISC
jgi:hypothetical protein